jgi:hypothetical protein
MTAQQEVLTEQDPSMSELGLDPDELEIVSEDSGEESDLDEDDEEDEGEKEKGKVISIAHKFQLPAEIMSMADELRKIYIKCLDTTLAKRKRPNPGSELLLRVMSILLEHAIPSFRNTAPENCEPLYDKSFVVKQPLETLEARFRFETNVAEFVFQHILDFDHTLDLQRGNDIHVGDLTLLVFPHKYLDTYIKAKLRHNMLPKIVAYQNEHHVDLETHLTGMPKTIVLPLNRALLQGGTRKFEAVPKAPVKNSGKTGNDEAQKPKSGTGMPVTQETAVSDGITSTQPITDDDLNSLHLLLIARATQIGSELQVSKPAAFIRKRLGISMQAAIVLLKRLVDTGRISRDDGWKNVVIHMGQVRLPVLNAQKAVSTNRREDRSRPEMNQSGNVVSNESIQVEESEERQQKAREAELYEKALALLTERGRIHTTKLRTLIGCERDEEYLFTRVTNKLLATDLVGKDGRARGTHYVYLPNPNPQPQVSVAPDVHKRQESKGDARQNEFDSHTPTKVENAPQASPAVESDSESSPSKALSLLIEHAKTSKGRRIIRGPIVMLCMRLSIDRSVAKIKLERLQEAGYISQIDGWKLIQVHAGEEMPTDEQRPKTKPARASDRPRRAREPMIVPKHREKPRFVEPFMAKELRINHHQRLLTDTVHPSVSPNSGNGSHTRGNGSGASHTQRSGLVRRSNVIDVATELDSTELLTRVITIQSALLAPSADTMSSAFSALQKIKRNTSQITNLLLGRKGVKK